MQERPYLKWDQFTGKKNSSLTIRLKALALADATTRLTSRTIHGMRSGIESKRQRSAEEGTWWTVYYDFLLYLMHVSDREAFELLDDSLRADFVEHLLEHVLDFCSADFADESQRSPFRKNFERNFVLFASEFSTYERGSTDYVTQNLSYQFAKRIQSRLGLEDEPTLILQTVELLIELELLLNIPGLLKESAASP